MEDLICIDDVYTTEQLRIFSKYGIKFPKKNEIVQFLRVDNLRNSGKKGIIVSPYDNQWIEDKGFSKEVSFNYKRFQTLLGKLLTEEMVMEELENSKKKEKVLIKTKEDVKS